MVIYRSINNYILFTKLKLKIYSKERFQDKVWTYQVR